MSLPIECRLCELGASPARWCAEAIEEQIAPFAPAVELLCTIPGIQRRGAEVIIAEIGTDMSVFPSPEHLASWAGQCPGDNQSAGHATLRPHPQRLQVARPDPGGSRARRHPKH
jgi:transposase